MPPHRRGKCQFLRENGATGSPIEALPIELEDDIPIVIPTDWFFWSEAVEPLSRRLFTSNLKERAMNTSIIKLSFALAMLAGISVASTHAKAACAEFGPRADAETTEVIVHRNYVPVRHVVRRTVTYTTGYRTGYTTGGEASY
jgi:hypothetical protein